MKIVIGSSLVNLHIVEKAIDEVTNEYGISQDNYGRILVSTLEAVNNAILHGNKSNPDKPVCIEIAGKKRVLTIKVTDQGNGFLPAKIPDPTMPENIEILNGRGVFIMSRLADKVIYNKKGNSVTIFFNNLLH